MGDLQLSEKGQLIGKGRLAEVFEWGDTQVLKLFTAERDPAAIAAEARVSQLVHEAGVPTPGTGGVIEVGGRRGIIYDRAVGSPMVGQLTAKPWKLLSFGRMLAQLHASVHERDVDRLPSQREQLEHYIVSADLPTVYRDRALQRLRELPQGTALCHGDFHPDNVLVDGSTATIIDWTTACSGNPVGDFARTSLILQLGALPAGASPWTRIAVRSGRALFYWSYSQRYRRLRRVSQRDLRPWILPIAVARLGQDVTAERDQLLTLIGQDTPTRRGT